MDSNQQIILGSEFKYLESNQSFLSFLSSLQIILSNIHGAIKAAKYSNMLKILHAVLSDSIYQPENSTREIARIQTWKILFDPFVTSYLFM